MMLRHFGINADPFGPTPDPRCLYESPSHREALSSLKHSFDSGRGFTALIAPPGLGKTTLLFRFLSDIREAAGSVFLFDIDSHCEPLDLLACILRDIGLTPAADNAGMHEQLKQALTAEARAGRKFVVVIDEAQNLSNAALEMVRLLTNFETPQTKLMHIVLSGQPQLSDTLMQSSLAQLRQRISVLCRLRPLTPEETRAYIDHRLQVAGYHGEPLFTQEALDLIAAASQGVPRTINNLCFNTLSLCCTLKCKQVNKTIAAEAIASLQLIPEPRNMSRAPLESVEKPVRKPPSRTPWLRWLWVPAIPMLTFAGLGMYGLSISRNSQFHKTVSVSSGDPKAAAGLSITSDPEPRMAPMTVQVEPDQTLTSIAMQYLGNSDTPHMQQIQALNPGLKDHPDHIEAGQTIWLPRPTAASLDNAIATPNLRNLP